MKIIDFSFILYRDQVTPAEQAVRKKLSAENEYVAALVDGIKQDDPEVSLKLLLRFGALSWNATDQQGDCVMLHFGDIDEDRWNEERYRSVILQALAPFVEDGSYFVFVGEKKPWRIIFRSGYVGYEDCTITWPSKEDFEKRISYWGRNS